MRLHHLLLLGTLALAPATALAVPAYTITDLGTLGGASGGFGINASGQVTGTSFIAADGPVHAFLWDPTTGMRDLGTLGGNISDGRGINASGQVTGLSTTAAGFFRAFLWDPATGMQDLGTLGGPTSEGRGINASGQVTGTSYISVTGFPHAFRWDPTTGMQDLGAGVGVGINASGQVTGTSNTAAGLRAFLWDPTTGMRDLGTLGGAFSEGGGINASGQVTGVSETAAAGPFNAFLWDPATGMRDLGTLGGGLGFGYGINDSGLVTGVSITASGLAHAFLWDGTGMLDLNDLIVPGSGWNLLEAGHAINDAGQITGYGLIGDQGHAFLLTPVTVAQVPEPETLALMGTGIIGLGLLRRRKDHNDTGTQARRHLIGLGQTAQLRGH